MEQLDHLPLVWTSLAVIVYMLGVSIREPGSTKLNNFQAEPKSKPLELLSSYSG